jgi:hypothetical protein
LFDEFGLAAIAGSGGLGVTDTVHPNVGPVDGTALKETQSVPPFCCWASSQRMIWLR